MWVKCGPGPQILSMFYPLTVRTSAGTHFTNGPNKSQTRTYSLTLNLKQGPKPNTNLNLKKVNNT